MDLSSISDTGPAALVGAVGAVTIKELVARFLRRSERLETKWDERHERLIQQLLDQVTGVRHGIEMMGERFAAQQATTSETKSRVDDHDTRLNSLETGHADLRAKMGFILESKND